ncbi:hypothetical protein DSECCO2_450210 [anaerobic digester metagenome]
MGFNMEHQKEHQKVHLKQCLKQCLETKFETKFETKLKNNSIFGNMPMLLFFLRFAVTIVVHIVPMPTITSINFVHARGGGEK